MSATGWEILFNLICFGMAILIAGFVLYMYRASQPRFYGLLLWALFLALCAALTFGLYTTLLEEFLAMKSDEKDIIEASSRLAENMKLLAFVVPGLMLAVAANLITSFLHAPRPSQID